MRRFNFCVDLATYNRICFLLTDDERAVLDYRRRGLGNAEIAAEMNCSERTVNRLVRAVVDKIRKIYNSGRAGRLPGATAVFFILFL